MHGVPTVIDYVTEFVTYMDVQIIQPADVDCLCCRRGQTAHESEEDFLRIVAKLDTYGVDPHCVKVAVLSLYLLLAAY